MRLRSFLILGLLAVASLHVAPGAAPADGEVRATWIEVSSIQADAHLASLIDKLRRARLKAVSVHVTAFAGDGAFPHADPVLFSRFQSKAQSIGLAVHGWLENAHRRHPAVSNFADPREQASQMQWVLNVLAA